MDNMGRYYWGKVWHSWSVHTWLRGTSMAYGFRKKEGCFHLDEHHGCESFAREHVAVTDSEFTVKLALMDVCHRPTVLRCRSTVDARTRSFLSHISLYCVCSMQHVYACVRHRTGFGVYSSIHT